jgi:hypothetical protein
VLGQDRAPTVKSGGTIWGTALGGQPWPLVGHTVSGQFPTRRGCAPVVALGLGSPGGHPGESLQATFNSAIPTRQKWPQRGNVV